MLHFRGSQDLGHDLATELNWTIRQVLTKVSNIVALKILAGVLVI